MSYIVVISAYDQVRRLGREVYLSHHEITCKSKSTVCQKPDAYKHKSSEVGQSEGLCVVAHEGLQGEGDVRDGQGKSLRRAEKQRINKIGSNHTTR